MIRAAASILFISATAVLADDLSLACAGKDWSLDLAGDRGTLMFPEAVEMDLMLTTPAHGLDWPKALTLVGARDTAIVILDEVSCGNGTHEAQVLTQRGQTPYFLTGCCGPLP